MTDDMSTLTMNPADVDASSVEALVGDEDIHGILDRYKVEIVEGVGGKPIIVWRCREGCGPNGNGHLGVIARNVELDQTNLTLGELVDRALRHAQEEHGEDYGLEGV